MFIVNNYMLAVVLCFVTMLCWGSWANTQKLAGKTWRYELFYWDYVIGILLFSILLGFKLGSVGDAGRSFVDDLRQITFEGTTVNIEQNDGARSNATMGDISRIYFSDLSSIHGIMQQTDRLVEYLSADEIAINSSAGSPVGIYSLTGAQLLTTRLGAQGGTISIANLPQGVYIVKANERTAKIIKR